MKKEELLNELQSRSVTVKFTKVDGTERVMVCTKSLELIPTEAHPTNVRPVKLDENGVPIETQLITVYDLEIKGWRSFQFDRVVEVNGESILDTQCEYSGLPSTSASSITVQPKSKSEKVDKNNSAKNGTNNVDTKLNTKYTT